MKPPCLPPLLRNGKIALVAASIAVMFVAPTVASCASSDAEPVASDASTTDGSALLPDATVMDGGAELTCADVAWCPVALPVPPPFTLRSVWGTAPNDVWAVGNAGMSLHFDGTRWTSPPAVTNRTLSAVGGSSKDDVWIAATSNLVFRSGFADGQITWTNVSLQPTASASTEAVLWALSARTNGDIWLGGRCFRPSGQRADATRWRGRIAGADGRVQWTMSAEGCETRGQEITAFWGSNTVLWAVGTSGNVYRTTDPDPADGGVSSWTELDSQAATDLFGVWAAGDEDVWIVGRSGTLRHFTGRPIFEYVEPPTDHDLRAVWGAASDDVWAVGEYGTILHYDGTQWLPSTAMFPDGIPDLYGVWGSGPEDIWAVGDGVVLRLVKPNGGIQ